MRRSFVAVSSGRPAIRIGDVATLYGLSEDQGRVSVLDAAGREYFSALAAPRLLFTVSGMAGEHRIVCGEDESVFAATADCEFFDRAGVATLRDLGLSPFACHGWAPILQWHGKPRGRNGSLLTRFETRDFEPLRPIDARHTALEGPGWIAEDGRDLLWRDIGEHDAESDFVAALYAAWLTGSATQEIDAKRGQALEWLDDVMRDPRRYDSERGLLIRPDGVDRLTASDGVPVDENRPTIFFGDNLRYAQACERMAVLLNEARHFADEARLMERAKGIRHRLDALAWTPRGYRHRVPLDGSRQPTDDAFTASQAAALGMGLDADKVNVILDRYEELGTVPWSDIATPDAPWLTGDCLEGLGQAARAAFLAGRPELGLRFLNRAESLTTRGVRIMPRIGDLPIGEVVRPLDLRPFATMSLTLPPPSGRFPWMGGGDPGDDLAGHPRGEIRLANVPFFVEEGAVGLAERLGWQTEASLSLAGRIAGVSLLFAADEIGPEGVIGYVTFRYVDGGEATVAVREGEDGAAWRYPQRPTGDGSRIGWHGPNSAHANVGTTVTQVRNPRPDAALSRVRLRAAPSGAKWAVLAATAHDDLPPLPEKATSPRVTGAGDVARREAFQEGLVGVRPSAPQLMKVTLSPEWDATEFLERRVSVAWSGAASQPYGCVTYDWRRVAPGRLEIDLTAPGEVTLRLPWEGGRPQATVNGLAVPVRLEKGPGPRTYACLEHRGPEAAKIVVFAAPD